MTLALGESTIGERGGASAEYNGAVNESRTAGIDFWSGRIGRPLTENEEVAIVVLADAWFAQRRNYELHAR